MRILGGGDSGLDLDQKSCTEIEILSPLFTDDLGWVARLCTDIEGMEVWRGNPIWIGRMTRKSEPFLLQTYV